MSESQSQIQRTRNLAGVFEIATVFLLGYVVAIAPVALLTGQTNSWKEHGAGVLGLSWWTFCIAFYAGVIRP